MGVRTTSQVKGASICLRSVLCGEKPVQAQSQGSETKVGRAKVQILKAKAKAEKGHPHNEQVPVEGRVREGRPQ